MELEIFTLHFSTHGTRPTSSLLLVAPPSPLPYHCIVPLALAFFALHRQSTFCLHCIVASALRSCLHCVAAIALRSRLAQSTCLLTARCHGLSLLSPHTQLFLLLVASSSLRCPLRLSTTPGRPSASLTRTIFFHQFSA
ncbi:hypothetical protein VNO80_03137 [Phaseolus coccineus]|uniref:Uncharacterized protein n=1 Tax=Phaseolus coccineus TaxID=3886 RepID=A0AAN9RM73_PHACN